LERIDQDLVRVGIDQRRNQAKDNRPGQIEDRMPGIFIRDSSALLPEEGQLVPPQIESNDPDANGKPACRLTQRTIINGQHDHDRLLRFFS
jgi:hypothetical protein